MRNGNVECPAGAGPSHQVIIAETKVRHAEAVWGPSARELQKSLLRFMARPEEQAGPFYKELK